MSLFNLRMALNWSQQFSIVKCFLTAQMIFSRTGIDQPTPYKKKTGTRNAFAQQDTVCSCQACNCPFLYEFVLKACCIRIALHMQAGTETQLCMKLVDWGQIIAKLMFPAIALRHSEQRRANARNGSLVKFLPPVVISPLSTRVSLPHRYDTPLSLKTKPSIRVLHWGTLQNVSPFLDSVLLVAHYWISHMSMTLIISLEVTKRSYFS